MKTSCLEGTRYIHEQEIQFILHYYLLKDTQNSRPCYGIRIVKIQSVDNNLILEESDQIFGGRQHGQGHIPFESVHQRKSYTRRPSGYYG